MGLHREIMQSRRPRMGGRVPAVQAVIPGSSVWNAERRNRVRQQAGLVPAAL